VASDDLQPMCVALLKQQHDFLKDLLKEQHDFLKDSNLKKCDPTVKIVFHYTRKENMDNIKTYGLMSHLDRDANRVVSVHNGKNAVQI